VRARRPPLPSCRYACPLPQFYPWRQGPATAFRAFIFAWIRCRAWWFRPRPARSPPELSLPRVFLRKP
jgi:hypothetical protein